MSIVRTKWGVMVLLAALAGCSGLPVRQIQGEEPTVSGPAPRANRTPLEGAFACMANSLRAAQVTPPGIAVGDVKDYTGKYNQNEGNSITQGGALMIYSALGKLGDTVRLHERFDTRIAELELAYADRRQLGDGRTHQLDAKTVPWLPYFGGSILRSQFYIVGGITELNYNIASGGAEIDVNGVGGRYRTYVMNVGVDLRIIDTSTLLVARTVSLQKQIVGEEVGVGVFRFFGRDLVDINIGQKNQEPLQLGVRTTIEQGVLELVGAVTDVDSATCIQPGTASAAVRPAADVPAPAAAAPSPKALNRKKADAAPAAGAGAPSGATPQNVAAGAAAETVDLLFEFGSNAVSAGAGTQIDKAAKDAAAGAPVLLQLVARDNESGQPQQRRDLAEQRAQAVTQALQARGIAAARIAVRWLPSATDAAVRRHGTGQQLVAAIAVSP